MTRVVYVCCIVAELFVLNHALHREVDVEAELLDDRANVSGPVDMFKFIGASEKKQLKWMEQADQFRLHVYMNEHINSVTGIDEGYELTICRDKHRTLFYRGKEVPIANVDWCGVNLREYLFGLTLIKKKARGENIYEDEIHDEKGYVQDPEYDAKKEALAAKEENQISTKDFDTQAADMEREAAKDDWVALRNRLLKLQWKKGCRQLEFWVWRNEYTHYAGEGYTETLSLRFTKGWSVARGQFQRMKEGKLPIRGNGAVVDLAPEKLQMIKDQMHDETEIERPGEDKEALRHILDEMPLQWQPAETGEFAPIYAKAEGDFRRALIRGDKKSVEKISGVIRPLTASEMLSTGRMAIRQGRTIMQKTVKYQKKGKYSGIKMSGLVTEKSLKDAKEAIDDMNKQMDDGSFTSIANVQASLDAVIREATGMDGNEIAEEDAFEEAASDEDSNHQEDSRKAAIMEEANTVTRQEEMDR